MRKIVLLFIGVLMLSSTGLLAQRTKGPAQPHEREKEVIYIEKIVEVQAPQQTTIIDIDINMCSEEYRRQTIIWCASHDSCRTSSSIEVLMAIDPMMSLSCRDMAYNSKLVAIQSGIDVHKRCLDAHGLYDINKNICKFTVELRRKTKVLETAIVWENENHICGKELFPNSAKKRRNTIVGVGLGSAALGAVGGGFLYQRVIGYRHNVKQVLKDKCGITDKTQLKEMAKNIREQKHTYVPELVTDLAAHGVEDGKIDECIAELNREAFYGELKTTFAETEAIITRETNGNIILEVPGTISGKPVWFETGKYDLLQGQHALGLLEKIYTFVSAHSCIQFTITGMASNLGNYQANKTLSDNRADAVKDWFFGKGITGISESEQITLVHGIGEQGPGACTYAVRKKPLAGTPEDEIYYDDNQVPYTIEYRSTTNCDNNNNQDYRSARFFFDVVSKCNSGSKTDQVYEDDAEFESNEEVNVEKARFYKKSDFVKGAVVGGVGTGALGAGIAALATKNMKCYISGSDDVLAKWKKAFSIRP